MTGSSGYSAAEGFSHGYCDPIVRRNMLPLYIRALPVPAIADITTLVMTAITFEEERQTALPTGLCRLLRETQEPPYFM